MSCEKETPSFGCVKDRRRMFESQKEMVSPPIISRVSKPYLEKKETRAEPVKSVSNSQQIIQTGKTTGFHSFSEENSGEKIQMPSRPSTFLSEIKTPTLEKQENFKMRNETFVPLVKSDDVKKTNEKKIQPPPPPPRSCQVIKNIQESNDDVFINTTLISNSSKMIESQANSSVMMVDKNIGESNNDVFINRTSVSNSHKIDHLFLPSILPQPEMEVVKNLEKSKENTSTNKTLVFNNHQMKTGVPLPIILPPPPPVVRERIKTNDDVFINTTVESNNSKMIESQSMSSVLEPPVVMIDKNVKESNNDVFINRTSVSNNHQMKTGVPLPIILPPPPSIVRERIKTDQDSFSISPSPFINSEASNSIELNDQNFPLPFKKQGSDYIPPQISLKNEQNKIFNDPVLIGSPKSDSVAPSLPFVVPVRKSTSNEVEMSKNNVIAPSLPPPPSTKVSKTSNVLLGWVKPPSVEKLAPVIQNPPKVVEDKVLKNAEVGKPPPIVVAPPSLESVRKIKEQASSRSSDGSLEETHEKEDAFKRESWFFDISKREASQIMKRPMKKGTFLMRPSENNQFVLMVRMESLEVRKFKIQRYKQGWILGDQSDLKQIHANLLKLMEHYRTNGIKVGSTTLILNEPVPKNN